MAATGEELETFKDHDDQMTHCTISEDGSLLISASDDATCNVRLIPTSIHSFFIKCTCSVSMLLRIQHYNIVHINL